MTITVLVVDDEVMNLEILDHDLKEEGYSPILAQNALEGLEAVQKHKDKIEVILLDRMMPHMDGIQFLEKIKGDETTKDIPVIMQTALADEQSIIEGIKAGVYYYLGKPFQKSLMISLVESALASSMRMQDVTKKVEQGSQMLKLMSNASFKFSTVKEAQDLAFFLASCFPDPEKAVTGLSEIMINSIEHGNLGIGYTTKDTLIRQGKLAEEINHRLSLEENKEKYTNLNILLLDDRIEVTIKDQGEGFHPESFFEFQPERALKLNGRGIMMAKKISFDKIEYYENGTKVICTTLI